MKKRKIEQEFIYYGLGLPIVLSNVPMVEIRGTWTPEIDYNALQKNVLLTLSHKEDALSGQELNFIRKYFRLTLQKFGKLFGVSHAAVSKWEKCKNKPAKIQLTTEREIRLFILDSLLEKSSEFRNAYRKLIQQQFTLKQAKPLEIDVQTDIVAI